MATIYTLFYIVSIISAVFIVGAIIKSYFGNN